MQDRQSRAQPLKTCEKCDKQAEGLGGVQMGAKWVCARCWIKYINKR